MQKSTKIMEEISAASFIDFIVKGQITNISDKLSFIGTLLAYEFTYQGSDLVKRRKSERVSIDKIKDRLSEATNALIGETDALKEKFDEWSQTTKITWESFLTETTINQENDTAQAASDHQNQLTTQKNEFIAYMDGCKTRIDELENTYQEKLRLEKPAHYWKKAARRYGIQGGLWSLALISSILLGLTYFHDFFSDWLKGQEIGIKLQTIQGVVIFGSILAVYAFLIRTLSRLTFSSFHLMRDAEEREQLTYLYLALNHGGNIDTTSRDIVLQALFSRTETGLLASESGPTMPGIVDLLKVRQ